MHNFLIGCVFNLAKAMNHACCCCLNMMDKRKDYYFLKSLCFAWSFERVSADNTVASVFAIHLIIQHNYSGPLGIYPELPTVSPLSFILSFSLSPSLPLSPLSHLMFYFSFSQYKLLHLPNGFSLTHESRMLLRPKATYNLCCLCTTPGGYLCQALTLGAKA